MSSLLFRKKEHDGCRIIFGFRHQDILINPCPSFGILPKVFNMGTQQFLHILSSEISGSRSKTAVLPSSVLLYPACNIQLKWEEQCKWNHLAMDKPDVNHPDVGGGGQALHLVDEDGGHRQHCGQGHTQGCLKKKKAWRRWWQRWLQWEGSSSSW